MREKKSLKVNGILNVIRSLCKIIFPLISYKYVSVVLGVENIGKYNFSNSIITYFAFIAALGVNAYAIRSGVAYREQQKDLEKFVSEVFTINIISSVISYILLFVMIAAFEWLAPYKVLIIILSTQIFFTTIGVEWLYGIVEDYWYITVRTIVMQAVSLILLVLFVKQREDTWVYALITVISAVGSNILNFFHAKKFCNIRLTWAKNCKRHVKPICIIFAQNISVLVFVNSDLTLLGLLVDDYCVGIYSVATNIYKGIKTVLSALILVSIPRLSYYVSKQEIDKFQKLLEKLFSALMTLAFPVIVGVIAFSKELVLLLSGHAYLEANNTVVLLSLATVFSTLSYIYGQCILIPLGKEKILLFATMVSALLNVGLNILVIPILQQEGAALTTIISEAVVFIICLYKTRIVLWKDMSDLLKSILGSVFVGIICIAVKNIFDGSVILEVIIGVGVSIVAYWGTEFLMGNSIVVKYSRSILKN